MHLKELEKELPVYFKKNQLSKAIWDILDWVQVETNDIILDNIRNNIRSHNNHIIKENSVQSAIKNLIALSKQRNKKLTIITPNDDINLLLELELRDYFENNIEEKNIQENIKCVTIDNYSSTDDEWILAFFDLSLFRWTKKLENIIKGNKEKQIVWIWLSHSYMRLSKLSKALWNYEHYKWKSLKELEESEDNWKFDFIESEDKNKLINDYIENSWENKFLWYIDDLEHANKIKTELEARWKKVVILDADNYNELDRIDWNEEELQSTDIYLVPKDLAWYITFEHYWVVVFWTLNNDQLIKAGQAAIIDRKWKKIKIIDCPREVNNFQKQQLVNLLWEIPAGIIQEKVTSEKTKGKNRWWKNTSTLPWFKDRLEEIWELWEKTDSDKQLIKASIEQLKSKWIEDIVWLIYLNTKELRELIQSISPLNTFLKRYKISISYNKWEILESLWAILGLEFKEENYYKEKVKDFLKTQWINSEEEALKRQIKNWRWENDTRWYRSFTDNPYFKYYCKTFITTEVSEINEKQKLELIDKLYWKDYRNKLKDTVLNKFNSFWVTCYTDLLFYKYRFKKITDLKGFINQNEEIKDFYNAEKGRFLEEWERSFTSQFKTEDI